MMSDCPRWLDYARASPRRRWRRAGFWCALGTLIVAGSVLGIKVYPQLDNYLCLRRCLRFTAPPDQTIGPVPEFATRYFFSGRDLDLLFMHGRTTKNGDERLVILAGRAAITDVGPAGYAIGYIGCYAYALPKDMSSARSFSRAISAGQMGMVRRQFRVFSGQPDPKDLSHWTIRYEIDGEFGTIDGWLQDDPGDMIRLEVRDGPAKPYAEFR